MPTKLVVGLEKKEEGTEAHVWNDMTCLTAKGVTEQEMKDNLHLLLEKITGRSIPILTLPAGLYERKASLFLYFESFFRQVWKFD